MTNVLMRMTVVLTVSLGVIAGVLQVVLDLQQEKDAVEINASELVDSLLPTTAIAVYNFDFAGAEQVMAGLFTQRAIVEIRIHELGRMFAEKAREPTRTLPEFGAVTKSDFVKLSRDLYDPSGGPGSNVVIGRLDVTIDRSIVPPAIVDRMLMYFGVAVLKNTLFGALLVTLVFSGLARHVLRLARVLDDWSPDSGPVEKVEPPRYLQRTEIDLLGTKIVGLSASASERVRSLQMSHEEINLVNSELRHHSEGLSKTLERRNQDLVDANRKLMEMASRDSLTTLFNRRYFEQRAKEVTEEAERAGKDTTVFLLDIDHFKAYNDFYGHQEGDQCLRQVAQGLAQLFDDEGLVARYGGEEFVAIAPDLSSDEVVAFAQKLVDAVADLQIDHLRSPTAKHVSISVGAASRNAAGARTLDELVGAADRALYEAKRLGRARAVAATEDLVSLVKREDDETAEMLAAVRAQAFEPFFQPQVDVRTGRIVGVEALARWRKDDGAYVEPTTFLAKARSLGLVADIDAIVQEKTLAVLSDWKEREIAPERLSINLSEERLLSGEARRLVERYPTLCDGFLAFELLESILLDRQSTAFQMRLDELRDIGVDIEIDDFGTGHASILGVATVLPDRIKIARELVYMLGADERRRKVVEAVVDIAEAFNIGLIAEGVETAAQSELLERLKCPVQQGFFHGRALKAHEIEPLLRAGRTTSVEDDVEPLFSADAWRARS